MDKSKVQDFVVIIRDISLKIVEKETHISLEVGGIPDYDKS
jgi:hypothetical protein